MSNTFVGTGFVANAQGDTVVVQADRKILNDPARKAKIAEQVAKHFGGRDPSQIVFISRTAEA